MAIVLTSQEIHYLRELRDGERTMSDLRDAGGLRRLIEEKYVTDQAINLSSTVYTITSAGLAALETAEKD